MPEGSAIMSSDVSMSEESPRLSTASCSSNERAPAATPSDLPSSDPPSVSLSSTLSSQTSTINSCPPHHSKGWSLGLAHNNNNNNKELQASRSSRGRKEASLFMTGSMTPNPKPTYLDRVVMEIIETERMYVRDLRMIVEDYLAHIIDCSDLSIRPEQVCSLFGNIEDIYEFNRVSVPSWFPRVSLCVWSVLLWRDAHWLHLLDSELLQALDLCDRDPVRVARCFVMKSEYFEIYTQYCTNYPNSVAALTDCMRIKSLAKFFRERQALLKRSLPLGSYLLKPVQRILKYHLLLQEIAKHFDPEEEGYEVVEEAIYTMTGVAWYINDMKRKHEHAVRLQEVQSLLLNWKGPDLTTYGELVLEGTFKVHRAKNERTLFLFDRVLLITKRRGEHYVYKTHISCSTLMLIENAKDSLSFSVTHYKHPKQPHTVQAKTVEEKKLWAHHIKRIILENHQAIIPQKAKDAILEMDSIYPPRYRYSPDRRRKAASSRWKDGGRRESEPKNQVLQSVVRDIFQDGSDISSLDLNKERGRPPEKEGGAEAASEQSSTDERLQETEPGLAETAEPDLSNLEPPATSVSPQSSEEVKSEVDPAQTEEPLSATPDSDSRALSSAESSEEEEEEEEEEDKELSDKEEEEATSILPSSVLDKASSIAQHFTNSIKRGSAAPDRPLACVSPRLQSRTSSSLSLSTEPVDRPLRFSSVGSDPAENLVATDLPLSSPQDDGPFEADRSIQRRRDSILSKQDQLLIGKIKSYYENAESQDATFGLQRRESLTYIPTGLVRSSVSRLDSVPKCDLVQMNPSTSSTSSRLDPSAGSHSATDTGARSLDSSDLRSLALEEGLRPQSLQRDPSEEEEFRPSSEMIKIWQTMEREVTRGHQTPRTSRETDAATKTGETCEPESEAPDLRQKSSDVSRAGSLKAVDLRAPVLRVSQLRAEPPCQDSSDDVDQTKSKVLHLARQYSQRIKTTKPVLRQRSQGVLIGKKSLPCVVEETEGSGKSDLTAQPRASSLQMGPTDQSQPPTSAPTFSSGMFSSGLASSRCQLTPPPPIEGFNWPDVRELRSKYCDQKSPVARSHSIPEQMIDGGVRRRSSCSSSLFFTEEATREGLSYKTRRSQDASRRERAKRLHRAYSLDPQVSGTQMSELQQLSDQVADGYFIAAESMLPNDPEHKITVIQKLPEPEDAAASSKVVEEESYVQIRSPTSREKISIMAVIDRCRAYQESDEYKQREEGKGQTECVRPQELDKTTASLTNQEEESEKTNAGHQSIVKNLREKFQSLS